MVTVPVPVLSLGGTSCEAARLALRVTVSASAGETAARTAPSVTAETPASRSFRFIGFLPWFASGIIALPNVTSSPLWNALRRAAFRSPNCGEGRSEVHVPFELRQELEFLLQPGDDGRAHAFAPRRNATAERVDMSELPVGARTSRRLAHGHRGNAGADRMAVHLDQDHPLEL